MREQTEHQVAVRRRGIQAANLRMRSEVLPPLAERQRLSPGAAGALAAQWSPWLADSFEGFHAAMDATDPLVLALMRDAGLLQRARRIVDEELARAMFHSDAAAGLIGDIVQDLAGPGEGSIYFADGRVSS